MGHIAKFCKGKQENQTAASQFERSPENEVSQPIIPERRITFKIQVGKQELDFLYDSGSQHSIIPRKIYNQLDQRPPLSPVNVSGIKNNTLPPTIPCRLQYLGGYVFRNVHRRLHKSQTWKTKEGQQMLSVIEAAKEASVPSSYRLVSCLNRGGLWSICTAAQNILARAEMHFKAVANVQSIDHTKISKICLMDHEIMANYQSIIEMSSIEVCKDVCKDVLQQIIDLFVRMRCYTYSRDIVQQCKRKQKVSK